MSEVCENKEYSETGKLNVTVVISFSFVLISALLMPMGKAVSKANRKRAAEPQNTADEN